MDETWEYYAKWDRQKDKYCMVSPMYNLKKPNLWKQRVNGGYKEIKAEVIGQMSFKGTNLQLVVNKS